MTATPLSIETSERDGTRVLTATGDSVFVRVDAAKLAETVRG